MRGFGDYDDLLSAMVLLGILVGAAAAGHLILPRLPERHRSSETPRKPFVSHRASS